VATLRGQCELIIILFIACKLRIFIALHGFPQASSKINEYVSKGREPFEGFLNQVWRKAMRKKKESTRKVHDAIADYIKKNPEQNYQTIADHFRCAYSTIGMIASTYKIARRNTIKIEEN
jgi:hypothetical protein